MALECYTTTRRATQIILDSIKDSTGNAPAINAVLSGLRAGQYFLFLTIYTFEINASIVCISDCKVLL